MVVVEGVGFFRDSVRFTVRCQVYLDKHTVNSPLCPFGCLHTVSCPPSTLYCLLSAASCLLCQRLRMCKSMSKGQVYVRLLSHMRKNCCNMPLTVKRTRS